MGRHVGSAADPFRLRLPLGLLALSRAAGGASAAPRCAVAAAYWDDAVVLVARAGNADVSSVSTPTIHASSELGDEACTSSGWINSIAAPSKPIVVMGNTGHVWQGSLYEAVRFCTNTFPKRVRMRTQAYTSYAVLREE